MRHIFTPADFAKAQARRHKFTYEERVKAQEASVAAQKLRRAQEKAAQEASRKAHRRMDSHGRPIRVDKHKPSFDELGKAMGGFTYTLPPLEGTKSLPRWIRGIMI